MAYQMPRVQDVNALMDGVTDFQRMIIEDVVKLTGKAPGTIRSTKPRDGRSAYVWRMVAFMVSRNPQHQCIPAMADMYIEDEHIAHRTDTYQPRLAAPSDHDTIARWDAEPGGRESGRTWVMMNMGERRRRFMKEELDPIVDRIVDHIKKSDWAGIHRWGRALGQF